METESSNAIIICGFYGCGKSKLVKQLQRPDIVNIDEEEFMWLAGLLGNPEESTYPQNLIDHVKAISKTKSVIILSTSKEIRDCLKMNGLSYHLVFPSMELREEYVGRAFIDGKSDKYCRWLAAEWQDMVIDCYNDSALNKYILRSHEFIDEYAMNLINENNISDSSIEENE